MRSLGKVINFSPKGNLLVRCISPPSIGSVLTDRKGNPVGRVVRVTGPVNSPYAMIKPFDRGTAIISKLAGKELYMEKPGEFKRSRARGDRSFEPGRRGSSPRSRSDRKGSGKNKSKRHRKR
ncbi:MAG: Gar1/Naf1 family protein [Thermoplasmatota archaeon]